VKSIVKKNKEHLKQQSSGSIENPGKPDTKKDNKQGGGGMETLMQ
jgi:hypothetical protein